MQQTATTVDIMPFINVAVAFFEVLAHTLKTRKVDFKPAVAATSKNSEWSV
jgi:hypothetical protein